VRERERRGQRRQTRAGQRRDVALVERPGQLGPVVGCARSAVEGVRVEEARERSGLEAVGSLEQRPEVVLPAQHPVGEEIEAGGLLLRDQLGEVALDLLVDGVLRRPPAVEVARRLDERFRARVDAGREGLQLSHGR
jgi:hypothetical protein